MTPQLEVQLIPKVLYIMYQIRLLHDVFYSSPEYNFEEPVWWPHYNGEPLQWCCEETGADGACAGDLTRC